MPAAGENLASSVLSVGLPYQTAPLQNSNIGTPTSGSTETFDIILGYYQVNLIFGHWYRVVLDGMIGNGGVAGDQQTLNIRNSQSSSNPTSSSTLVAQTEWHCVTAGSGGRTGIPISSPFQCVSGGINTFGFSSVLNSGTGPFTPVGSRSLYVVDIGGN